MTASKPSPIATVPSPGKPEVSVSSASPQSLYQDIRRVFSRVDLLGIVLDVLIFWGLIRVGLNFNPAHLCSFLTAAGAVATLKYKQREQWGKSSQGKGWLWPAFLNALAALCLRAGLLAILVERLAWSPYMAILFPAIIASSANAAGWRYVVIPKVSGRLYEAWVQSFLVKALIVYSLLLKLFYLGLLELLHEEGYYWNYSQHLDLGYLDHPPMVGWVSYVSTSLLGNTEFAVRLGPYILWFVGAYYLYRLTRSIFDRETAMRTLMLFAVLPYFFGISFVLLPDAALVAFWAAALYYLYRMLIHADGRAFIGIGIFIALGLLSKYTMILLGFAALVFVIIDPPSRKLLKSPGLWMAIVLAAVFFLPVIIWNANHEWASFHFQSTRRAGGSFDFDLPDIIGAIMVLLTPTGLMAAFAIIRARGMPVPASDAREEDSTEKRSIRLLLILTVLPLSVFVFFSLFRNTKLIWTGPIWLGILPILGAMMSSGIVKQKKRLPVLGPRPWTITAVTVLLIYGLGFHYLCLGLPGVPFPKNVLGQGWHDIACQVEKVVEDIEDRTGQRPLVVGMDKDRINSWLAFYRGKCGRLADENGLFGTGAHETSGRHIFGRSSGMYLFWFPTEVHRGKTLVLVGRKPNDLMGPDLESKIIKGGEIRELTAEIDGRVIRKNDYRVVEGYHP
jgi:dolichol-phosphate mannosyltransferase